METALSFYQLIPEQVNIITSVTTKKTQSYENYFGSFVYHKIKISAYGSFNTRSDEYDNDFLIATPERCLLDYLYFKGPKLVKIDFDWFVTALRLQNTEIIDADKLLKVASNYGQKKILSQAQCLATYVREHNA